MIPTNFPIQTKHRTQMMITETAKNTSSKKIYSQHSFNHTPKKILPVGNNRFFVTSCLQKKQSQLL